MTHKVRRQPQQLGPAGWNAILEPQPAPIRLEDHLTADFLVIGAGFAGLSAARRLAQLAPGARVIVLEAGRIAQGAAGRNSGFMIDLPHDLQSEDYAGAGDETRQISMNRQAIAFAGEAVEEYGINPAYFDHSGKVNGAASKRAHDHNLTYARHLSRLGEECEALDAQAMHTLTGSRHYRSGLYCPGTVTLQPAGYIRGLAKGLSQAGTRIFEQSGVVRLERKGPDWQAYTQSASVTAPKVITAVNGHLESFGFARGRLMQIFLYAVMTPELDPEMLGQLGGAPRWGITPSDPMGTTVRRIDTAQGGNRIITRTCASLRQDMRPRETDLKRAARTMRRKFDARFPQLAGLKMSHAWAGHLCLSLNGASVTGRLEDGLYSACVQNGLGTARGTLTGMACAEMACGQQTGLTRHFGTEPPPKRLPPFSNIGVNAVLRLREWKASEE